MPYAWQRKDLRRIAAKGVFLSEFVGAEMAWVRFRTDPTVVREVLPRPLRVPGEALATAFVARYPRTNWGVSYMEGALFVDAEYKGEVGSYCLSMPVDNDVAMVAGRERHGYPKKIADRIELEVRDRHVVGSVVRNRVEILRIEGDLPDERGREWPGATPALDLKGQPCLKLVSWLFKYFPAAYGGGFEYAPLLVREPVLFRPRDGQRGGRLELKLVSSPTDPLGDIPVLEVVESGYGTFDNTMLPGRVIRKVRNRYSLLPKALFKFDWMNLIDFDALPSRSVLERWRLRQALRRY